MKRIMPFLLAALWNLPAAAQEPVPGQASISTAVAANRVAGNDTVVVTPLDSVRASASSAERALAGAITGGVSGAVLAGQDASCAPDSSVAESSVFGAFSGAVRGLLGFDDLERVPLRSSEPGLPGPFPFDGEECDQTVGEAP
ncbi:MAG: hypothetical protein GEU90_11200 [Gemmatimonas sp.]|nr:hypothetical protein [Gemmatimonas sp.]